MVPTLQNRPAIRPDSPLIYELGLITGITPCQVHDRDINTLIDPELATIASIETQFTSFPGSALCALVNANRGTAKKVNIVFIDDEARKSIIVSEDSKSPMLLQSGSVITHDGKIVSGKFKQPIEISFFDACQIDIASQQALSLLGARFLTDPSLMVLEKNKWIQKQEFARLGINFSRGFVAEDTGAVLQKVWKMKQSTVNFAEEGFALKALDRNQGSGVKIITNPPDLQSELNEWKIRPFIVEERIPSLKLASLGEQGDWVIRVLLSRDMIIDTIVDHGKEGDTVNSIRGAKITEFSYDLFLNTLTVSEFGDLKNRINEVSLRLAQGLGYPGILGLDIIVNKNLIPYVIELNGGNVGGLTGLAKLRRGDRFHQLMAAESALMAIEKRVLAELS